MMQSNALRILYVGHRNEISSGLHTLFEQRNQIAGITHAQSITLTVMTNQKTALRFIRAQPPDALWVEVEQRPESRLRFCETVRYRLPSVSIVAIANQLPAKNEFKFDGLVTLPLTAQNVSATVMQMVERRTEHRLTCGPISLDLSTRTVVTPNGRYTMTPKQCALLKLFIMHHGEVVKRRQIMERVWETSYLEDTRTLDVHIRWLRERIELNPSKPIYLKTVRGTGYCFQIT